MCKHADAIFLKLIFGQSTLSAGSTCAISTSILNFKAFTIFCREFDNVVNSAFLVLFGSKNWLVLFLCFFSTMQERNSDIFFTMPRTIRSVFLCFSQLCLSIIPIYSSADYDAASLANISQSHDPNATPRNF